MKKGMRTLSKQHLRGFTLVELMITISIVAILLGIIAPSMRSFMLNSRISSTANELLRSIQTARSEATKRQKNVVICMIANIATPSCVTSGYVGWIVFEDSGTVNWDYTTGEPLLETHTFDSTNLKIFADGGKRISYGATGFSNVNGGSSAQTNSTGIVVCDARGNTDASGGTTGLSVARGIVIATTGRVRMTRVISSSTDSFDISDLLGGSSC